MIRLHVKGVTAISQAGLEQLLMRDREIQLVSPQEQPDLVVVEIEGEGEEAWEDLSGWSVPGAALVVLADAVTPEAGQEAMRQGARAFLPRRLGAEELASAIRAAAAGLLVIHPDLLEAFLPVRTAQDPSFSSGIRPFSRGASQPLLQPLTPREREVLLMMAAGRANKQIAAELAISEHTVKYHVASIMGKLGASSRTEAVTAAIRSGIIMV